MTRSHLPLFTLALLTLLLLAPAADVRAHCDTMNGPVVADARKALLAGDVRLVLHWVKRADEAVIIEAFQKTLSARAASSAAREVADRWFFETLVRVHRAGEGAPYTGLKEDDDAIAPGIAAADRALAGGSLGTLDAHLTTALHTRLEQLYTRVTALAQHDPTDVEAGRRYVAAYVTFIHGVEALVAQLETATAEAPEDHGTSAPPQHRHGQHDHE